jgi:hypothetical protein
MMPVSPADSGNELIETVFSPAAAQDDTSVPS